MGSISTDALPPEGSDAAGTADRLAELERRYRALLALSPVAFIVSTPAGRILDVNRAWIDLFGHEREAVLGADVADLRVWVRPDDRERILARLARDGTVRGFETNIRTRTGEMREVELGVEALAVGGEPGLVWAIRDMTERNKYQRALERQALTDTLTGLPNRVLFLDRLEHAVAVGRRGGEPLAVLLLDLDDFRGINDGYGHAVGDRVLTEMAVRVSRAVRSEDTVARLSGDEFAALLERTGEASAVDVAERILSALGEPIAIGEDELSIEASVGISVQGGPAGFRTADQLVQSADVALHRARQAGAGEIRVFGPDDVLYADRLRRRERLREAIEHDELVVYYQPVVDLREGVVVGAEALVRWNDPDRGLIPPGEFIPLAEASGLIRQLDDRVLAIAAEQAARWLADEALGLGPDFQLGVNIAPHRYDESDLARHVLEVLESSGLPPGSLQLEITERLALKETRPFHELRGEGVRLAIDDFGTGYSSLLYLRHLEADTLKVDRYFVNELDTTGRTSIIVRSVLSIGAQLGVDVIAEGVETEAQRDHLRDLGCRLAQGYFFARPMPAAEFEELLRTEASPPAA